MPPAPQSREFKPRPQATEVFAFGTPSLKGGTVVASLHVHGALTAFSGPANLWRSFAKSIEFLFQAPPEVAFRKLPQNNRTLSPEMQAKYEEAARDFLMGKFSSRTEAAAHHRLNYSAWYSWMRRNVVTERPPMPKPNGKLP